jgi:hypothetical protein
VAVNSATAVCAASPTTITHTTVAVNPAAASYTAHPATVVAGRLDAAAGRIPRMCATLADQQTTRLLLYAGTQKLTEITDRAPSLPDSGWLADLIVTSEQIHPSIVTTTRFEVRDLAT